MTVEWFVSVPASQLFVTSGFIYQDGTTARRDQAIAGPVVR